MPKFSHNSFNAPLLPSQGAGRSSVKGKIKVRRSAVKFAYQAVPPVLIAIFLFVIVTLGALLGGLGKRQSFHKSDDGIASSGFESPLSKYKPKLNSKLKERLDALVQEATAVARELGIITEVDAAIEEQERSRRFVQDWSHLLDYKDTNLHDESHLPSMHSHCDKESCGPRGVCDGNLCRCVAGVTGSRCGHSIIISKTLIYNKTSFLELGYFGTLLQGSNTVRPPSSTSTSSSSSAFDVRDNLFKEKVYEKCAIVGHSSSVLFSDRNGKLIDSYPVLLRMNPWPWDGLEAYLGYEKGIAVIDRDFWVRHSEYLVSTYDAVIVVAGTLQSQDVHQNLFAAHPRFLSHINEDNGRSADGSDILLPALALALNLCRSITIFGAYPVLMPASMPTVYYDVCDGGKIDAKRSNEVASLMHLKDLVTLGLVNLGEPCILECKGQGKNVGCLSCRVKNGVQFNVSLNC